MELVEHHANKALNMKINVIFIGFILCSFSNNVCAQTIRSNQKLESKTILRFEKFIIKNYNPDTAKIRLICENSCVFAKFKVSSVDRITDLTFSENANSVISAALVVAFRKAEINKQIIKGLRSKKRVYLLPIVYYYDTGCYVMKKANDEKVKKHDSTATIIDEEMQGTAIYNILKFSNGESTSLNITVLKPIAINEKAKE